MTIVLKVKFGDDTRRLTLEKQPTYGELLDLLRKLYVNLPTAFAVKYIDEDEDQITIGSDLELNEAIRVSGGPNAVLRLFVSGASASQTFSSQSLPDLLKGFSPPTATANSEVPDLVNLFQNLGLNTSSLSTNDPEQLRSQMKTQFQQLLSSPFIFNLIPMLMPYLPQITAFLSSFEEVVKKEPALQEQQVKSDVVHEGVVCDSCGNPIHGIRYKCSQCWNYDLCESCEKQGSHDKNHILLKIQLPIQHQQQFGRGCPYNRNQNNNNHCRWKNRFQKKHLSRYVADVTIPDGSKISTSSSFIKIWRMRNEGQEAWPAGTYLEHVGGDQLSAQSRAVLSSAVEPGEEVEIAVDMIAPGAPGRYVSFWKLVGTDGIAFGQRVWADICVENVSETKTVTPVTSVTTSVTDDTPVSTSVTDDISEDTLNVNLDSLSVTENVKETEMDLAPSSPTEEFVVIESNGELEDKVKQLQDMGFGDLEMNRRLLVTHDLDMVKTVQQLLNA